jgi:hypothetical protein
MVVTVLVFVRKIFDLQHIITLDHLEKMNKVILATGMMVGYAYAMEFLLPGTAVFQRSNLCLLTGH